MSDTPSPARDQSLNGWLFLDKPAGLTSMRCISRLRQIASINRRHCRIGHAGTLDPFATGLLPIAFGQATKTISRFIKRDKKYTFTLQWGTQTNTDDLTGTPVETSSIRPSQSQIEAALPAFTGTIEQTPPAFSAIHVNGKRAYALARNGQTPKLSPRPITVYNLTLINCPDQHHASFTLHCSSGTYVRAIGRDLARALGTVAHIVTLRRTTIGALGDIAMNTLEAIENLRPTEDLPPPSPQHHWLANFLHPITITLDDLPQIVLNRHEAIILRQGQSIDLDLARIATSASKASHEVLCTSANITLAIACLNQCRLSPKTVFNLDFAPDSR